MGSQNIRVGLAVQRRADTLSKLVLATIASSLGELEDAALLSLGVEAIHSAKLCGKLGSVLPVLFDERNIPESLIPPESLVRANAPGSSVWPLASILAQPGYNAAPQGHVDVESVKRWVHFMNTRVEQGSGRVLPEDAVEDLQSIQYMGFHELVRQVMVSNFERGEALLELWRMKTELDDLEKQDLKKKISALEAKLRQGALSKESKTGTSQRPAPTRKKFRPSHRVSVFDHATIARVDMQRFSEIDTPKIQSFNAKKKANEPTRASTAGPHDSPRKSSILPIFERFFLDLESELPDQSTQSTLSLNPDEHLRSKALYKDLCEALEKVHELEEENERLRLTGHT
ncbi:Hypothetical Protein FCC1311_096972 [Hondaea fermentalgiana]|uniref:Uncharacterized protein n=1 Tax=Hondaea fermentalgiana TaxID=2315210 RepID=A0A2R5GZK3_9STRA|nr:Hypothetical Protein FCC1311_096972 [Hondaea fermentalgiana]|eukprot:GBG33474.1 Hypothetical Protein FCC1311_096972 [Hondaea fermentalgiana]